MNVSKLEFLADAIAEYAGSHDPKSQAYKLRNPLALKEVRVQPGEGGKKVIQFGELRAFKSWTHGYEAGLFDLKMKASGKSSSGLTGFSSIAELIEFYGMRGQAENVANYLSFALEARISSETKLFVFLR